MINYHYAIVRYVHDAATDEFVNIGIIMWLPKIRKLVFRINERYARVSNFFQGSFDAVSYRILVRQLRKHIESVQAGFGAPLQLDLFANPFQNGQADIFESVLRTDATCFRLSEPMYGVSKDPDERLERLFSEYIEVHEPQGPRERRGEAEIWSVVEKRLVARGLSGHIKRDVTLAGVFSQYQFRCGWHNSVPQFIEPVSFDYVEPREVIEKAQLWSGRLLDLSNSKAFKMTAVIAGPRGAGLSEEFNQAVGMLNSMPSVRKVLSENDVDSFMDEIEHDIRQHRT